MIICSLSLCVKYTRLIYSQGSYICNYKKNVITYNDFFLNNKKVRKSRAKLCSSKAQNISKQQNLMKNVNKNEKCRFINIANCRNLLSIPRKFQKVIIQFFHHAIIGRQYNGTKVDCLGKKLSDLSLLAQGLQCNVQIYILFNVECILHNCINMLLYADHVQGINDTLLYLQKPYKQKLYAYLVRLKPVNSAALHVTCCCMCRTKALMRWPFFMPKAANNISTTKFSAYTICQHRTKHGGKMCS